MPEVHLKELYDLALTHFNEPMICNDEVVRLIGYGETAIDCYYIVKRARGRVFWSTCVGGNTFLDRLKGQGQVVSTTGELWDDLYRLDNSLHHRGCTKEDEFLVDLRHDDDESTHFSEEWEPDVVKRVARAWASIDGKLEHFDREAKLKAPIDWDAPDFTSHYIGYIEDAKELIRRAGVPE